MLISPSASGAPLTSNSLLSWKSCSRRSALMAVDNGLKTFPIGCRSASSPWQPRRTVADERHFLRRCIVMYLPDFPVIPPEAFAALARQQRVPVSQITPLPDVGITNKIYGFGEHLILRVPRDHPHIVSLAHKEA